MSYSIEIVNVNNFREPSMKYGADVYDGNGVYAGDVMFFGDEFLEKCENMDKKVMDKNKIIGIDISNKSDSTVVNVSFKNKGTYTKELENSPITYEDRAVGVITEVSDELVNGYIFDMKFYQEYLSGVPCSIEMIMG